MVPRVNGALAVAGRVGQNVHLSAACEGARLSALNALAAVSQAVGGLAHIEAVVQLRVFVRCTAEFTDVSAVAEGASRALVEVLGPTRGTGVRTAVGVFSLPGGSPVEVELVATYNDQGPA
jgi:hypothetical protein